MDFGSLHFIRPAWLLSVPLALLLPWLWRHLRRASGDWSRVCDPHLLRWLSVEEGSRQRSSRGAWLAGFVLLAASITLAGPSWQRLPDTSYSAADARILVLDLSMSMLAEDLKPNRLTRTRYRLVDILAEAVEGQIGMVAFAGDAYVVAPLTSDTNTVTNMLPALRPDVVPVAGSRADRGLNLAAELLRRAGVARGEILLITDDARSADAALAGALAREGFLTSVLAVGTREGAPIPSGQGFVTDAQGNVVIARLELESLRAVAEAGGGRLSQLSSAGTQDSPWLAREGGEFSLRDEAVGERWRDLGPWLLVGLLPLVAVGFRRGLIFVMVATLLPGLIGTRTAEAGVWEDLWQRRDQQAQNALERNEPDRATALAKDPAIAGEGWYRQDEYQRAAESWSQREAQDDHYNRGNALAKAGRYDDAIAAYQEALRLNPDMEDALFNKALVEQLKEQEQQQQDSEDQSGEGEQQEGEQEDSEQQGESSEDESQQGDQQGEPEDAEQGGDSESQQQEQVAQAWTEEDAQAMEQWLRRIPDDPGGLLRRKFRNEHQKRGAPSDEKKTW